MTVPFAGWTAEFASAASAIAAAGALRAEGYRRLELHAPYELEDASDALGLERPRWLPRVVLIGGLLGAGLGYGVQWLTNGWLYPLVVGARPPHSPPAFVPITFESGILFGAFAAFFGLLAAGRMIRLWQPIFDVPGFDRATLDRFWVIVDRRDPRFDVERTRIRLESFAPLRVEAVGTPPENEDKETEE